jgi:hypothetical protein
MKPSAHLAFAIAAVLGGCSGPQSTIDAPVTHSDRQPGRPPSGSGALLYAASADNNILIYDYPGHVLEQSFDLPSPVGACSDANGNVFITGLGDGSLYFGYVYEFAHGGSSPIAILPELRYPSGSPAGCSVDLTTGNLAVANGENVAVFTGAQGTPTYYSVSGLYTVNSCAYDDQGNLAASGLADSTSNLGLAMLWSGAKQFQTYTIENPPSSRGSAIQFDGRQFGIVNFIANSAANLYRMTFTHSGLHFHSMVWLRSGRHSKGHTFLPVFTWIAGRTIIAPYGQNDSWIGFWKYPGGGRVQSFFNTHREDVRAVTVSVPPS